MFQWYHKSIARRCAINLDPIIILTAPLRSPRAPRGVPPRRPLLDDPPGALLIGQAAARGRRAPGPLDGGGGGEESLRGAREPHRSGGRRPEGVGHPSSSMDREWGHPPGDSTALSPVQRLQDRRPGRHRPGHRPGARTPTPRGRGWRTIPPSQHAALHCLTVVRKG